MMQAQISPKVWVLLCIFCCVLLVSGERIRGYSFIIDGEPAKIQDFRFTTQIFVKFKENPLKYVCTGSLLGEYHILTAAHCVQKYDQLRKDVAIHVVVGHDQLYTNMDMDSGVKLYNTSQVFTTGFGTNSTHDIAVLKLYEKVPSSEATPIKIYTKRLDAKILLEVAGWGVTDYKLTTPADRLLKTQVIISSSENCTRFNKEWVSNDEHTICTEPLDNRDSCHGDSGGPLVTSINGVNTLVGITSWGLPKNTDDENTCGRNTVSFYVHANSYVDWVADVMNTTIDSIVYS